MNQLSLGDPDLPHPFLEVLFNEILEFDELTHLFVELDHLGDVEAVVHIVHVQPVQLEVVFEDALQLLFRPVERHVSHK